MQPNPPPSADPMMPPAGSDVTSGNPATDQAAEDVGAALQERYDALAKRNPTPTQAILYTEIVALVKALNEAVGFLSDGTAPPVSYTPQTVTGGAKKPLPTEVYVLLEALAGAIRAAGEGSPDLAALAFDPAVELTTRAGVQALTQKLMQASRSQALKAAMAAINPEAGTGEMAPAAEPMM